MTAIQIAREYFPNLGTKDLESIIWGLTGFPSFWNIPKDGNTPEECFRKQLQEVKSRFERGMTVGDQLDQDWPSVQG